MEIMSFIRLFGGLAIFIYGMTIMGNGLERVAGSNLEKTLEKVAGNLPKALFFGLLVTVVLQSSSATTVMVIGFVNAGIMTLGQSVGIILGANIGTTITSQIIRLDTGGEITGNFFMQIIKPSNFAYVAVLIGVLLFVAGKSKKQRDIGSIFIGFGILFIGMSTMEAAVSPLRDIPAFQELFIMFTNPILGVIIGALVTAIIQSSSASVGILQALSTTGLITYASAVPIILGQNIGTCVTAVLSSLNANKNAKRAACVHFYFNVFGTILFLAIVYSYQHFIGFGFWDINIDKAGIANFHTIFNLTTVLFFIPFSKLLVTLAEKTIPYEEGKENPLSRLDKRFYNTPELALEQVSICLKEISEIAHENYKTASNLVFSSKIPTNDDFRENEKFIDTAEVEISKYLLGISGIRQTESKMKQMEMFRALSDFEKIGDYSNNIYDIALEHKASNLRFGDIAKQELESMISATNEILDITIQAFATRDIEIAKKVGPLEDIVDILKDTLRTNHLTRLNDTECTIASGQNFLEIAYNLEKIADHCFNISICIIQQQNGASGFNTHSYLTSTDKKEEYYVNDFKYYENKYLSCVK